MLHYGHGTDDENENNRNTTNLRCSFRVLFDALDGNDVRFKFTRHSHEPVQCLSYLYTHRTNMVHETCGFTAYAQSWFSSPGRLFHSEKSDQKLFPQKLHHININRQSGVDYMYLSTYDSNTGDLPFTQLTQTLSVLPSSECWRLRHLIKLCILEIFVFYYYYYYYMW